MEAAARGKQALASSNFQKAIEEYTTALQSSPTSPDYLIQRATAYQRSQQYALALADANNAVLYAQQRAKRELIIEAQFRRACALHSLGRHGDADFVFQIVKRMDDKHKTVATFMKQNQMKMDKLPEDDENRKVTVTETPDAEGADTKPTKSTTAPAAAAAAAAPPAQTPKEKIRWEWYQNTDHVYFTLLAKGVAKEKAHIDIQERSLTISFPLDTGSSYDFTAEPLFGPLKPEKCIIRILPSKIELVLAKANSGQKWTDLESKESITATSSTTAPDAESDAVKQAVLHPATKPTGPAYPTSSKSGPKDWDKVVKESSSSNGKGIDDDEFEGGDEANAFFKKLYKDASPEVQRAMMKSYTESNGTALSTNWDEVSKGKVETVPPDGMEARTWEK